MVEEDFLGSAIRFRMNINITQIASSASQPLSSNTHNEASMSQMIEPGILPSSQPPLTSDQSRVDILTRHRDARRTRRRRRTPSQQRPLAQQIRRRQMANQYRQQQEYYRNDRIEERERHEREDQDRYDAIRRQPSAFSDDFEDVIEERLQEVYDWEIMQLMDGLAQEQLYELEGIAALEQLPLVQDQMQQSYEIQTSQASEEEAPLMQDPSTADSVTKDLNEIEAHLTPQSFDSILYHMEGMQQMHDMHKSDDTTEPNPNQTEQY